MSVRLGVLALLAEAPSHGYQLKSDFQARTGSVWTVNVGQIYTILDRLAKDGLAAPVEDAADGDRRPWAITPEGRKVVEAWFSQATVDPAPPRDELLIKVLIALGQSSAIAQGVIDTQRTALYRQLQADRRSGDRDANLAARLMAEAVRSRHEADLAWLDRCEELKRAAAGHPARNTTPLHPTTTNQPGSDPR